MERDFRIQLINSLGGFKSIGLIGTKSTEGVSNLGIFNTIFHVGSSPAYYGFLCRPSDRERHTLENILATKSFTINQVHNSIYKQAHQSSAKYPRTVSEFEEVGLTELYLNDIHAPFVQEAKIKFGMQLAETHALLNKTTIVIGRVEHISIERNLINDKGFIQLDKADTLAGSGCDAYYEANFVDQLTYAQPDKNKF